MDMLFFFSASKIRRFGQQAFDKARLLYGGGGGRRSTRAARNKFQETLTASLDQSAPRQECVMAAIHLAYPKVSIPVHGLEASFSFFLASKPTLMGIGL